MEAFELYKDAIEQSRDFIFWVDSNGVVIFSNNKFKEFFSENEQKIFFIDECFEREEDWFEFYSCPESFNRIYETIYTNNEEKIPVEFYISKLNNKDVCLVTAKNILERKKFEYKIKRITDALIRSNDDLQDFAYIASHDLQEPLRKITVFGDILSKEKDLSPTGEDALMRMVNAAKRMKSMIEDILDYSRAGSHKNKFEQCNLNDIIKNVLETISITISEANAAVIVQPDLPLIYAEPIQMNQLMQNLIQNSIKFRRKEVDCKIEIKFEGMDKERNIAIFSIKDNGIGIKKGQEDKIFSPFTKLHSRSQYGGTGMGLAICKKIINRYNGEIFANSKEGEWTKIFISLPLLKREHTSQCLLRI